MTLAEVRKKYLEFFEKRGHAVIPSASLVPENDPTTLFTGSGMQPLVPYLLGMPHPLGKRVANSQKSFRAEDIDEVGDNRHTTFFEMLGNWSFGDYFKKEQLPWFFEFLTKEIGLPAEKLYVTVFAGDPETGIPADTESVEIWKELFKKEGVSAEYIELGSEKEGGEKGMQGGRIFSYGVKKNWWSRAGVPKNMPAGEPGGPDSEVFYDFGTPHDAKFGKECHPNCDCGRFLEIGNSVFMEYKKKEDGTFEKLAQRNVDFGGGLERITAASDNDPDVFKIDVFRSIISILEKELEKKYAVAKKITNQDKISNIPTVDKKSTVGGDGTRGQSAIRAEKAAKAYRTIADHLRAATFLSGDGVHPSNKERGYLSRRLIRRAVFEAHHLGANSVHWISGIVKKIIDQYAEQYPNLREGEAGIISDLQNEATKFLGTIESGVAMLYDLFEKRSASPGQEKKITGEEAFDLFTVHGFPLELTMEKAKEVGFDVDVADFNKRFRKHQDLSRTASAGTFKGGLADHSEKTTQLHTTHHLLLKALQIVLGPHVKQRGSNITSERLRIDFSADGKMTDEQKKEVEKIVNEKIAEDLPVIRSEIAKDEAEKLGAEHEFGQKYPDRVSVYSVGPKGATVENPQFEKAFSIEFCGGPHVDHTGKIVGKFRIVKEEASSAGVRRIKGVLE